MTSSPGLHRRRHLQARHGVLQTTTDDERQQMMTDNTEQNNTGPLHYL